MKIYTQTLLQCPHCHAMNPKEARFCFGCGAELARQCVGCGHDLPADARFCPRCGAVVLAVPAIPWWERHLTPAVRRGLTDAARGVGVTLIIMGAITAVFTPPWEIFAELFLLAAGAALLVLAHTINPGRKPKPPGGRLSLPDEPPPGGIEIVQPDEVVEIDAAGERDRRMSSPGGTQGPFLN